MDKMAHPIVTAHTAGWKKNGEKKVYFYGTGVPVDYAGEIPQGFEIKEFLASDYLVFSYPVFDYMSENADVMSAVEKLELSNEQYQATLEEADAILRDFCTDISKTNAWCAQIRQIVEERIANGEAIRKCREVIEKEKDGFHES